MCLGRDVGDVSADPDVESVGVGDVHANAATTSDAECDEDGLGDGDVESDGDLDLDERDERHRNVPEWDRGDADGDACEWLADRELGRNVCLGRDVRDVPAEPDLESIGVGNVHLRSSVSPVSCERGWHH